MILVIICSRLKREELQHQRATAREMIPLDCFSMFSQFQSVTSFCLGSDFLPRFMLLFTKKLCWMPEVSLCVKLGDGLRLAGIAQIGVLLLLLIMLSDGKDGTLKLHWAFVEQIYAK
jgi:hypothetical protein